MQLYFSGVSGVSEASMLAEAGVTHYLADPTDFPRLPADSIRALDSGAYRAFKAGKFLDVDVYCKFVESQNGALAFAVAPDVIGDYDATLSNWERVRQRGLPLAPVWGWGGPPDHLAHYLDGTLLP